MNLCILDNAMRWTNELILPSYPVVGIDPIICAARHSERRVSFDFAKCLRFDCNFVGLSTALVVIASEVLGFVTVEFIPFTLRRIRFSVEKNVHTRTN